MTRFEFQDVAISELCETFRTLWYAPGTQLPLVFKSPTGSGKTFMVTSFINDLTAVHNFDDDIAWVWITFSDDLAMQSKEKFSEYFYPNAGRRLLTVADFSEGKLRRNDILFLNWQKLVSGRAEARVLRKPNDPDKLKESGCYFEDVIAATKSARRKIALVIDESHKNVTEAAVRDVINPLDPKVIVKVSATPETEPSISDVKHHKAGFVEVERADVVKEGLIKSAIVSQTEDEVKTGSEESDMDHKLLDLAMKKRAALAARWTEVGSNVNPLVLIQLPDDDAGDRAQGIASKEDIVIAYLKSKGVTDDKIAWWFSGGSERKKNLEGITVNDCKVEYMLFKYAAGTGWDCPRSHVMVMFREINSTTFKIQTLGRILRNPEPRRKDELAAFPDLTVGYLYTNYSRNQVEGIDEKEKPNNPLLTRHAKLIDELASQIGAGADGYVIDEHLLSEYISRADYGDLGKASTFQASFAGSMDAYFGITADDQMGARTSKVGAKGVELTQSLTNAMIVNAEWKSDDPSVGIGATEVNAEVSANDAEKMFTRVCTGLLVEQTEDETKVTNIARSAGVFRGGVRKWLKDALPDVAAETGRYKIFLKDISKGAASVFRPAITAALKAYYPKRKRFVEERRQREEARKPEVFTLNREYAYSEIYKEYADAKLSAVQPFLLPEYDGRENETKFIAYLEQQTGKIDWWFKNGDEGREYFALKYFNTTEQEVRLFYPDWIIRFKDGRIGIFDTKAGMTATNPEGRAKGLYEKICTMNVAAGRSLFVGGLVVFENGQWYFNDGENYAYSKGHLNVGWKQMQTLFG